MMIRDGSKNEIFNIKDAKSVNTFTLDIQANQRHYSDFNLVCDNPGDYTGLRSINLCNFKIETLEQIRSFHTNRSH